MMEKTRAWSFIKTKELNLKNEAADLPADKLDSQEYSTVTMFEEKYGNRKLCKNLHLIIGSSSFGNV